MLDKTYRPAEVEARIYAAWEDSGLFAPRNEPAAKAYCIVLPPPNVTGSLHMGHALDHTIQDALIRFERMRGKNVLWQAGTDHAGIATQMVVERELAREGSNVGRREMGREAFVAKVWEWKERSGGTIVRQMRRLGDSPDWSRERFTMDEGLSKAVLKAFVGLYRKGLIYKDKRLVNWDTKLESAVSDLEVQQQEVDGHLWHLTYPVEDADGATITVATTRPETMLGDTGIAVHPDDDRYRHLVGKNAILPLVGRRLPIVADTYSDPEKGTGAVKITPAHDFNDFEVGRRHGLEAVPIMDELGRLNENVPDCYRGLDRFEARKRILADLEKQGVLAKTERHRHAVPHGDRSGTPLEPFLTDQWYCDAATLAKPAIAAVEEGRTVFVPQQWQNTYFEWMRNIQPWCISRQLWWGHQIPAWYAPDGTVFVEESEEEALAAAEKHFGEAVALRRDEDVLDTWFSSGLWPFSTLGWPDETPELKRYYPTDVLVTGFDIIFFWVARMMMLGIEFMGEVPFRTVYIHGLVRDEGGQKMSKTKGNVIDPLELIDTYGADALRLSLLASTQQGRDIKFGPSRVEGFRNFTTKLWNASRFVEMNEGRLEEAFEPGACSLPLNRWIVRETAMVADAATQLLEQFQFSAAAFAIYHFVWETYCDWYVELAKPLLQGEDEAQKAETRATAAWVLKQILHLIHPLAPFVSEELWERLFGAPGGMLIAARWPELEVREADAAAHQEIDWLVRTVRGIRATKQELNLPVGGSLTVLQSSDQTLTHRLLAQHHEALLRLARVRDVVIDKQVTSKTVIAIVVGETTFGLSVDDSDVLEKERQRLRKEIDKAAGEAAKIKGKLDNPSFLERAPAEVVEEQRERLEEAQTMQERLAAALARIA